MFGLCAEIVPFTPASFPRRDRLNPARPKRPSRYLPRNRIGESAALPDLISYAILCWNWMMRMFLLSYARNQFVPTSNSVFVGVAPAGVPCHRIPRG